MNDIGARMVELRENMGLTQKDVAKYLEIPNEDLMNLESGDKTLTLSILNNLCNLYGCSEKYLLCKSDEFNLGLCGDEIQAGDLKGISIINKIYKNSLYLNKKCGEVMNKE